MPKPSLDRNPVLWREWQHRQPSRWVRVIWAVYVIMAGAFGAAAMFYGSGPGPGGELALLVNAFQVSIGLLLLSVGSVSSLAEERARGSLGVLLATPLTTRSIVWGKWWGAYKWVPVLAAWPALVAAIACPNRSWPGVLSIAGLVLVYGAAITSLGLALATWLSRLGRAMAVSIIAYVAVSVGWFFLVLETVNNEWVPGLACASPFYGAGLLTADMTHPLGVGPRFDLLTWSAFWMIAYAAAAAALYFLTLRTFDGCLGRTCSSRPLSSYTALQLREPIICTEPHA